MGKRNRPGKLKEVRPKCHIYVEGQETEVNYIKGYIVKWISEKDRVDVQQPTDHSPYGLLTKAKVDKQKAPAQDVFWLVFDHDQHPKLSQTFQEAREAGINIAYSSICFETWILMHFNYTTKAYLNCDAISHDLEQYFPQGYEKGKKSIYALTVGADQQRLAKAIDNAKKLCRQVEHNNPGKQPYDLNPYTDVFKLLHALDEFLAS